MKKLIIIIIILFSFNFFGCSHFLASLMNIEPISTVAATTAVVTISLPLKVLSKPDNKTLQK